MFIIIFLLFMILFYYYYICLWFLWFLRFLKIENFDNYKNILLYFLLIKYFRNIVSITFSGPETMLIVSGLKNWYDRFNFQPRSDFLAIFREKSVSESWKMSIFNMGLTRRATTQQQEAGVVHKALSLHRTQGVP